MAYRRVATPPFDDSASDYSRLIRFIRFLRARLGAARGRMDWLCFVRRSLNRRIVRK